MQGRGHLGFTIKCSMKSGQFVADRYEIKGLLGRGGMGEVYLALDHRLQVEVALKQVPLALALEAGIREALIEEARILARLSHSRIVRLFDLADTVDGIFLVLEYVCGPSFEKILAKRPVLGAAEVLHLIEEVSEGLAVAHGRAVYHRDLKPSNLLVELEGDDQRRYLRDGSVPDNLLGVHFKVTDFGLAKVVEELSKANLSGRVVGTPAYMAPEQFRGEGPSAETDVYALGLIAYQCLAGRIATGGAEPSYFHVFMTPAPLEGVAAGLNEVIQKALRKERKDRYRSVTEFAAALRGEIAPSGTKKAESKPSAVVAEVVAELEQGPKVIRRRVAGQGVPGWVGVGLGLASIAVLGGGLALNWFQKGGGRPNAGTASVVKTGETVFEERVPPLGPIEAAPRIDTLPPVIERLRREPGEGKIWPKAAERPRLLWQLRVPGSKMLGFGADGTLYLGGDSGGLSAVKNGKLVWSYHLQGYITGFWVSNEGLMWVETEYGGRLLFCFNGDGQGGELTVGARKRLGYSEYSSSPVGRERLREQPGSCEGPNEREEQPFLAGPSRKGKAAWKMKLDQRCNVGPLAGPDGMLVAQTTSRMVFAVKQDGSLAWTYRGPCIFSGLMVLPNGMVVGSCEAGKRWIGFSEGEQRFVRDFEHGLSALGGLDGVSGVDREGSFYGLESSNIYTQSTLHRIDSEGKSVWTLPLQVGPVVAVRFGEDGQFYLFSSNNTGTLLALMGGRRP